MIAGWMFQMRDAAIVVAMAATASITPATPAKTSQSASRRNTPPKTSRPMAAAAKSPTAYPAMVAARASAADSETKKRRDPAFRRAQRFQNADFFRPLDHHFAEVAGDAERRDGENDQGQQKKRRANLEHDVRFGPGDGEDGAHIGRGELLRERGSNHARLVRPAREFR